jgi:uncharacterized protein (TIGR00159 family)
MELFSQLRLALDLLLEIRIADVVDIAIVTTLLYSAIALVRRTQAVAVAVGILTLGVLYIAARLLDLRLTVWIFQGFFAVFLVILVVIFQEELRQLFERVALWSFARRNHDPAPADELEVLVKCAADFAEDRIGALLVLPGKRPISRHIQGGVELGGRVSEPLVKSLFDPHSPGHDGAAVVEQGRVTHFAVHLPLSTDFEQLARVGTRHSAALGLAELTDALCLVVSEERGEISVAREGRLRRRVSPHQLSVLLREFHAELHPPAGRRGPVWQLLRENWAEKLLSLFLVLGLWWMFVPGSRPATVAYEVPVEVANLPPDLQLESVEPRSVTLVFTGLRRAFYLFRPNRSTVTVDVSLARLGRRTFKISDDDVTYPKDLALQEVEPPQVKISVRPATGPEQKLGDSGGATS